MKLHIITIGTPKLSFTKEGSALYLKRLGGYHTVDVVHLPDAATDDKILGVLAGLFVVALDERGKDMTSAELAHFLDEKSLHGVSEIAFFVGGPDGHSDTVRSRADALLRLSAMTFPHDIALLLISEALYRASTIMHNHPYHRA